MQKNEKPTYEQLLVSAKEIVEDLKKLQANPGWQKYSDKPCQMSKIELEGNIASKGVAIVNYAIEKIVKFLSQVGVLKKLNPTCVEDNILFQENDVKVTYMRYSAPWPVSHRDFVSVAFKHLEGNQKAYIGSKSCNYPHPQEKKVVRGEITIGGYVLERIDENKTKVTYMSNADIKGSIPGMIKNELAKKQGEVAAKIEEVMKAEKIM